MLARICTCRWGPSFYRFLLLGGYFCWGRSCAQIRRLKSEVASQLPPKRRQIIRLHLEPWDLAEAAKAEGEFHARVAGGGKGAQGGRGGGWRGVLGVGSSSRGGERLEGNVVGEVWTRGKEEERRRGEEKEEDEEGEEEEEEGGGRRVWSNGGDGGFCGMGRR